MKHTYFDFIRKKHTFPQDGFDLEDGYLTFHGISLKYLIDKYGTPFKLVYLPSVRTQIQKARDLFERAIKNNHYQGKYEYSYCTKCNHYHYIVNEALSEQVHLETSSAMDMDLIFSLLAEKKLDRKRVIIHNGYKPDDYLQKIIALREAGFQHSITILDSLKELERLTKINTDGKLEIGLRMAINEQAQSPYRTSRLGIRSSEMIDFFRKHIKENEQVELKMLHFFVDSGIEDSPYYWEEFHRALHLYTQLKKECHSLDSFNLGGGFPIRNHLKFEYDYELIINKIIQRIKEQCAAEGVPEPDIYTEFGKYTVGESSAILFQVLEQKQQNDSESWYIIDNSLMHTLPDAWAIQEKFILLPINKWENDYQQVNIGGISCDHFDYYNSEDMNQEVLLPKYPATDKEPLYLAFFHTGAYQDAISGYGGIKHCLIPSPKQIIIDTDNDGKPIDYLYLNEQTTDEMFKTLGYKGMQPI